MTGPLDRFFAQVTFGGVEPFERDEYGLAVVIEDDAEDDLNYGLSFYVSAPEASTTG